MTETPTDPKQLRTDVPADAVQIVIQLVNTLRMDGLTGQQVAALFQSITTIHQAISQSEPKAE